MDEYTDVKALGKLMGENYAMESAAKQAGQVMGSPVNFTIRQNIDAKIARAIDHVDVLRATKARLEKSGLLDVPIGDLRDAMNF